MYKSSASSEPLKELALVPVSYIEIARKKERMTVVNMSDWLDSMVPNDSESG